MVNDLLDTKEILSKVNIVNIVKNYVPLQKKGRNFFGICPFHNDTNPSMVVSEEKQIFKCFVCGTGGNAINFVQKKENISYRDALIKVAEIAGFNVSKYKNTQNDRFFREKKCFKDLNEYYTGVLELSHGIEGLQYCESRGLNSEIRKVFNIGFAPINGENTINYLKGIEDDQQNQMYSLKLMQDYGICTYKNGKYRDIYEGRVTFGICNQFGEIVGFSARYLKSDPNSDMPKYINTKETPIFHKSEILYNFNNAKNISKEAGFIYLVEGFMDVIAFYKVGIKSCVALMGTALSDRHITLLKNENVEVRLCLDNDNAGQTNTLSIVKKLNKAGINFRVVKHNNLAKDSDELLSNHGKDVFLEKINDLITQQDFIIDYYSNKNDLSKDIDKKTFIKQVFNEIISLEDKIEIEEYCKKMAEKTDFSRKNIENEFYRTKKKVVSNSNYSDSSLGKDNNQNVTKHIYSYGNTDKYVTKDKSYLRIEKLEHLFMKIILDNNELSNYCLSDPSLSFINPIYNEIHFYIKEYLTQLDTFNIIDFIDYVNNTSNNSNDVVYEITQISLEEPIELKKEKIDIYSRELACHKELYLLDKRIKNELNDAKKAELMLRKSELKKKLNEFTNKK